MAFELPTRTDLARYSFDVDLDDVNYTFAFEWNDRDSGWYLSIHTPEGDALLQGRRVVLNYPLCNLYKTAGLPAGTIMAIDSSGKDTEPGFGDLGERVKLVYLTAAELGIVRAL